MKACDQQYFGKYRGTVANNVDPKKLGRIQVSVPAVLGDSRMSWAMPCVPFAGKNEGWVSIPPIGANIWVEFEAGDLDLPIWSGCFWGTGEMPTEATLPDIKVFKTRSIILEMSDVPGGGGFTLEVKPPAVTVPLKLVFDRKGIEIGSATGSVTLKQSAIELKQKPAKVKISSSSIELENGQSTLELSPAKVAINNDALEVM